MSWWKEIPWRQIQTNLREIDMLDIDAQDYVRQMQSFDATVAMINVGGIIASYETDLPLHFQSPYLKGDSLKTIIDACHKAGIRVVARTDFSKVRRAIYEMRPDFAYRTKDGDIVDYNGDVHACICGEYQGVVAFDILREINEKLDIDGLFINMGGFQTQDYSYRQHGICHCDNCKRKFHAMSGLSLPHKADMADPTYRAYRRFQRAIMQEYHEKLHAACRVMNPNIAINGIDFQRMESNTEYKRPLPFWQYSASSNSRCMRGILQQTVPSNTSVDFVGFPYRHIAVSPAQQALRMWQNLSNLGNLDYYLIGRLDNHQDRSGYAPIREAFQFHKKIEKDYHNLHSVAQALVLRNQHWGCSHEEMGWIRALTENHILFDEGIERDLLEADLSGYRAIIIPGIEVLADAAVQKLDAYAQAGGCMVATGRAGRYDGEYEPRDAFPLVCMGIEDTLSIREDMLSAMFDISADDKRVFSTFTDTDVTYPGDLYAYHAYKEGTTKYMRLIPPQHFGPPERCYGHHETDHPGVTVHAFGQGKGVRIPWLPGTLLTREGYDNTFWVLKDVLLSICGLDDTAPGTSPMVEVAMGTSREGTHALVQLVNGTGHFGTSYFAPVPVRDVHVAVPCGEAVAAVYDLTHDVDIPFVQKDGFAQITLPELGAHACVKLQFAE